MCVAQISSYQDEVLALIRKAQSRGLQVVNIEYDADVLAGEGSYVIDEVTIIGARGPFTVGTIGAQEYIAKFLAKLQPSDNGFTLKKETFCS